MNIDDEVNVTRDAFVELLASGEKDVRTATAKNGNVELLNVPAGTYYLRLTIDYTGDKYNDTKNNRPNRRLNR